MSLFSVTVGCGPTPYLGPRAIEPPVSRENFHLFTEFVEVDSLTPELRWEEFPPTQMDQAYRASESHRIEAVRYELRVWRTINGYSGELAYARDGLAEARHRVEAPLSPSSRYLWSVRAKFTVDGTPYVSQWALSAAAMRSHVVPNPMCFRFVTPAAEHGADRQQSLIRSTRRSG